MNRDVRALPWGMHLTAEQFHLMELHAYGAFRVAEELHITRILLNHYHR